MDQPTARLASPSSDLRITVRLMASATVENGAAPDGREHAGFLRRNESAVTIAVAILAVAVTLGVGLLAVLMPAIGAVSDDVDGLREDLREDVRDLDDRIDDVLLLLAGLGRCGGRHQGVARRRGEAG